jgi:hypothetical protein
MTATCVPGSGEDDMSIAGLDTGVDGPMASEAAGICQGRP